MHYLPHKPVVRHYKAITKLRIVFDTSAKVDGLPSLNDCLYVGPSLTSSLFGVIIFTFQCIQCYSVTLKRLSYKLA